MTNVAAVEHKTILRSHWTDAVKDKPVSGKVWRDWKKTMASVVLLRTRWKIYLGWSWRDVRTEKESARDVRGNPRDENLEVVPKVYSRSTKKK